MKSSYTSIQTQKGQNQKPMNYSIKLLSFHGKRKLTLFWSMTSTMTTRRPYSLPQLTRATLPISTYLLNGYTITHEMNNLAQNLNPKKKKTLTLLVNYRKREVSPFSQCRIIPEAQLPGKGGAGERNCVMVVLKEIRVLSDLVYVWRPIQGFSVLIELGPIRSQPIFKLQCVQPAQIDRPSPLPHYFIFTYRHLETRACTHTRFFMTVYFNG